MACAAVNFNGQVCKYNYMTNNCISTFNSRVENCNTPGLNS